MFDTWQKASVTKLIMVFVALFLGPAADFGQNLIAVWALMSAENGDNITGYSGDITLQQR